jgi:hypothetical protein
MPELRQILQRTQTASLIERAISPTSPSYSPFYFVVFRHPIGDPPSTGGLLRTFVCSCRHPVSPIPHTAV